MKSPPKVVPLWVLIDAEKGRQRVSLIERVRETKGLIMESYGDYWVVRSYKANDHNEALKTMICSQCHVTPMVSYMIRSRKVKNLN